MNVLAVIFIALAVWRIFRGFKNGLAREINGLLSLFMALAVISAALLLFGGILQKNTRVIVIAAIVLAIAGFLYRFMGMLMKSIETVAGLPVINLVNMLAGAAAGAAEILIVFWILYIVIGSVPAGPFGERLMGWTRESVWLMYIYDRNYIARWITGLVL